MSFKTSIFFDGYAIYQLKLPQQNALTCIINACRQVSFLFHYKNKPQSIEL